MKVTPIAWTTLMQVPTSILETEFALDMTEARYTGSGDIDTIAEFAGRACYQSWNKPNPATSTNRGYLANIIDHGHFSVLEHGSVTFYVEGVSRALTHELIRHRHLSYSELSQRYVDMADAEMVTPPAMRDHDNIAEVQFQDGPWHAPSTYVALVDQLLEAGLSRKEAREAARAVLPNAMETKIVVTGNLRAWRDVLAKRWHEAADAEIREFAGQVLDHLRYISPGSVQDIPTEPYGYEPPEVHEIRKMNGEVVRTISTRPLEDADEEGWGQ